MIGASSQQRIWQRERGAEQPRPRSVPELSKVLNVEPLELLDGDRRQPSILALHIAAGQIRDEVCQQAAIARTM
jgi:transcriptional regulator with XRE-family HTH domain